MTSSIDLHRHNHSNKHTQNFEAQNVNNLLTNEGRIIVLRVLAILVSPSFVFYPLHDDHQCIEPLHHQSITYSSLNISSSLKFRNTSHAVFARESYARMPPPTNWNQAWQCSFNHVSQSDGASLRPRLEVHLHKHNATPCAGVGPELLLIPAARWAYG